MERSEAQPERGLGQSHVLGTEHGPSQFYRRPKSCLHWRKGYRIRGKHSDRC